MITGERFGYLNHMAFVRVKADTVGDSGDAKEG
jgi:hypothetical protein